jgi:hypothetical protein
MDRVIKFKVYCEKHNREEIYTLGDLVCGGATSEIGEGGIFSNWRQFTGLTDKNGVEIYEGDIFKHHIHGNVAIAYYPLCQGYLIYGGYLSGDEFNCDMEEVEIIGNIHENPELLEVDNG